MTGPCDEYKEKIAALLTGDLSPSDAGVVEGHVNACDACRRYREGLFKDDRLLKSFVQSVDDSIDGLEARIMETIGMGMEGQPSRRDEPAERKSWIFNNKFLKLILSCARSAPNYFHTNYNEITDSYIIEMQITFHRKLNMPFTFHREGHFTVSQKIKLQITFHKKLKRPFTLSHKKSCPPSYIYA